MNFVPYVCCGDPSLDFTYALVKTLAPYSYAIELGIPFSDPIADGPTIQAAANRALSNGVTVERIFGMVERLRTEGIATPFVFMTYYNIVYAYGREAFLQRMKKAGVQAIIIPDLPFGEDLELERLAKKYGISMIHLIAPNTPEKRAKMILAEERLFTYLVSVAGTTGAKDRVAAGSLEIVKRIRMIAGNEKKLLVGFGISNAGQAKVFAGAGADGVIVGSEIINRYSKYMQDRQLDEGKALNEIADFARSFSE